MAAPSTLTLTYISAWTNGIASANTTVNVPIPKPDGTNPIDFGLALKNIFLQGGLWFVNASGVQQFIPWGEITSVTAQ